jgi:ATP-dependent Clp protease protease subunit
MPNNKFWNFKSSADKKSGELLIYGEISGSSWFGDEVTPTQFKKDMDALGDISELNIYINSPGGDVFAGQAIYSILKRKKCAINVYVDGLAASAASLIAMVGRVQGNTLHMPNNAMLMIHNPWSLCAGYSSNMRKMADELDKVRDAIVPIYKEASGLDDKDIIELLDAETWMTAQDALDYGFITETDEGKKIAASISGKTFNINGQKFDISMFKNFPADKFPKIVDDVVPEDISKNIGPNDDQEKAKNFIVSVIMEALETNEESLRDTLKNLSEQKPEKEPTQSSGFFNTQKHADKISQLVERSKNHERKA